MTSNNKYVTAIQDRDGMIVWCLSLDEAQDLSS